jgi:glyoxylase-like metal-dependent hydrolase (beta-lactamase superfamily II)
VTRITRVLAPNPGPYTLEGTNTWVVGERPALVVDPGPPDEGHVQEIVRSAGQVAMILLTHHHPDHAPAAAPLAALTGARVATLHPAQGERALAPGEVVRGGGIAMEVVPAPGHSADHCVFHAPDGGALFTGDAVLGRGTSVVDPPDGDMTDYVESIRRMLDLGPTVIYPGHGPAVWSAPDKLREYLEHRGARERQVLDALRAGPRSARDLVPEIYGAYPEALHDAAARSALAHLLKLEREGIVTTERPGGPEGEPVFALVQGGGASTRTT